MKLLIKKIYRKEKKTHSLLFSLFFRDWDYNINIIYSYYLFSFYIFSLSLFWMRSLSWFSLYYSYLLLLLLLLYIFYWIWASNKIRSDQTRAECCLLLLCVSNRFVHHPLLLISLSLFLSFSSIYLILNYSSFYVL